MTSLLLDSSFFFFKLKTNLRRFGSNSWQQQPGLITAAWYNVFITAHTVPVDPALHFISLSLRETYTQKETDLERLVLVWSILEQI